MQENEYKQPSIFVVDDDEDDLFFIKSSIVNNIPNSRVKCFIHGRQLMDDLLSEDGMLPTFILLDLNMPVLNGRETLRMIRETKSISSVPVVIFSTSNNPNEKSFCLKSGANDYYCKPSSLTIYDEIIRKLRTDYIDKTPVIS
jgi:CheY-like chemotaxis protein